MWYHAPVASGGATIVTNQNDLIVNDLGTSTSTANATSYTCTLGQPATNSLMLAFVQHTQTSPVAVPTSLSGNNVTWVMCGVTNNAGASTTNMLTVWRAQGATPTAGTLTVNVASSTGCEIHVIELQGADATAANGASAIVQVTQTNGVSANPLISCSQSTGLATNAFLLCVVDGVNATTGRGANTNWVLLSSQGHNTPPAGMGLQFQVNATTNATITETASSRTWLAVLVEVKPGLEANPLSRPQLVQWFSTGYDSTGRVFTINLDNPTVAGNLLELYGIANYGNAVTITDNKGVGNWSTAVTNNDSTSGPVNTFYLWYLTNTPSGITTLTVSCTLSNSSANGAIVHFEGAEYANVAQYSPIDGISSNTAVASGIINAPGMLTTADGDLILLHTQQTDNVPQEQLSGFGNNGMQFLVTDAHLGAISTYGVQAKAGSIAPFTAPVDTGQHYLALSAAFKRAQAGNLRPTNSIYLLGRSTQWIQKVSGTKTNLFFAHRGNLTIMTSSRPRVTSALTPAATDWPANNNWTKVPATTYTDEPQTWYGTNMSSTPNHPLILSITQAGSADDVVTIYDVEGASAYPYDTFADTEIAGADQNSIYTPMCSVTPSTSNSLIINTVRFSTGPPWKLTSPSGAVFESIFFTGTESDGSYFNFSDCYSMCYSTSNTATTFGVITTNNAASDGVGLAVVFKSK